MKSGNLIHFVWPMDVQISFDLIPSAGYVRFGVEVNESATIKTLFFLQLYLAGSPFPRTPSYFVFHRTRLHP